MFWTLVKDISFISIRGEHRQIRKIIGTFILLKEA
jgi:hypothetical protein